MTHDARTTGSVRLVGAIVGAVFLSTPLAFHAAAQGLPGSPISPENSPLHKAEQANSGADKVQRAPDSLPGAKARAPVAPASKSAMDMAPNDAMFDAINRGDMATVKDALSRGADLQAHNILGMTPLELSVDLGRNDISFLLLSMRGDDSSRLPPSSQAGAAKGFAQKGGRNAPAPRQVAGRHAGPNPIPVAQKAAATPKLFANDGGTPQPNAGFLGFDSRQSN
jgi:hypothetical protein